MSLFETEAKITLDDKDYTKGIKSAKTIGKDFAKGLGEGLKKAGKAAAAGMAAATAGVVALAKASTQGYADFEQLVGGVETLYGAGGQSVEEYAKSVGKSVEEIQGEYDALLDSQNTVLENAKTAYANAGMDANEYMETVTGFSASLLQSMGRGVQTDLDALEGTLDQELLEFKRAQEDEKAALKSSWDEKIRIAKEGGQKNLEGLKQQREASLTDLKRTQEDELATLKAVQAERIAQAEEENNISIQTAETRQKSAELANQTVIDMADNANKMGSDMKSIQLAYQGFAKQNYTINIHSLAA